MPISDSAAHELAQLLGGGTAGGLIPELLRQGLQAMIKSEALDALGADRHERSDHRRGHHNGSSDRLLPHQPARFSCAFLASEPAASSPFCWSHATGWIGPCGRW